MSDDQKVHHVPVAGDLLLWFHPANLPPAGWTLLGDDIYWRLADGTEIYPTAPVRSYTPATAPHHLRQKLLASGMQVTQALHVFLAASSKGDGR